MILYLQEMPPRGFRLLQAPSFFSLAASLPYLLTFLGKNETWRNPA
jgi:hypothetical protein